MRRLLLVDDDVNVLHALQRSLRQCAFAREVRTELFSDPLQALARPAEVDFGGYLHRASPRIRDV